MATNLNPAKIVRPSFLKTDPPKPVSTAYTVPRMAAPVPETPPQVVWRVTEVELDELIPWLIPSFLHRWPRLSDEGVISWLKSAIYSKTVIFIRTRQACGAAEAITTPWEPMNPVVREVFTRYREPTEEEKTGKTPWVYPEREIVAIYDAMKEWAKDIKAREFRLIEDTNARISTLDKNLPEVKKRTLLVYPLYA